MGLHVKTPDMWETRTALLSIYKSISASKVSIETCAFSYCHRPRSPKHLWWSSHLCSPASPPAGWTTRRRPSLAAHSAQGAAKACDWGHSAVSIPGSSGPPCAHISAPVEREW